MGRKRTPGLYFRRGTWHIDKIFQGQRLCECTGTCHLAEAEKYLARRIEQLRQGAVYGIRPKRLFREAATRYLLEKQHKRSIEEDAKRLRLLDRYIGDLTLDMINMGTLKPFIVARKQQGVKNKTINLALEVVRHILNLAASEWYENGLTWLAHAPKIRLLPTNDSKTVEPISWQQQEKHFRELPKHLREMATYKVNVGCREQEVCQLQWDWEYYIPELDASVFLIPGDLHKNGLQRYHFLNREAQAVIERQRGKHPVYVFIYNGHPITRMNNTAWKKARKRSGVKIGVHVLKHTLGERLRAVGVSKEDAKDILGHKNTDITIHYSKARIENLIAAVNKVCDDAARNQTVTLIKASSRQSPANANLGKKLKRVEALQIDGGSSAIRTQDQQVKSLLLYRLS